MADITIVNDTIMSTNIEKQDLDDILNGISDMDYIEIIQIEESVRYNRADCIKKIYKKQKGRKYSYHSVKDIYTITENNDNDICNVVESFNYNDVIGIVTESNNIHITINDDMNGIYSIVFCKYNGFFRKLFNSIIDFFIRR